MVLELSDFAAWRIDWGDKAANIAALVADLNLGLQSVVFIDDNPHERARVAEALPEVLVPEWPDDPRSYPRALRALACFDNPVRSVEDISRTQLYATERRRTELLSSVASLDDWIRQLDIVVRADALGPGNLPRACQLLNKTNQMNLATRRLTEDELITWASDPGHATWCVTVADRLGDAGLTGLVSVSVDGDEAQLVDFVLSCRVMGRRVEAAMVHLACGLARELGAGRLVATLLPTAKNDPCRRFFDESGLTHSSDDVYGWDLTQDYPPPRDLVIASPTLASAQGDG
jgi:FkbH-like protein